MLGVRIQVRIPLVRVQLFHGDVGVEPDDPLHGRLRELGLSGPEKFVADVRRHVGEDAVLIVDRVRDPLFHALELKRIVHEGVTRHVDEIFRLGDGFDAGRFAVGFAGRDQIMSSHLSGAAFPGLPAGRSFKLLAD